MIKENTPLIETDRLILRKFTEADIADVLLIYGDETVNEFLPWFSLRSMKEAREYLARSILPDYTEEIAYRYAIALKQDNRPIGYVGIGGIGQSNDIGYGLRKEFWHKGIATEASTAVINRCKKAGFPYITATHDINNPYSGEVMKKIGMTYRYSYEELWQPKNFMVTFRMYQLNFDDAEQTYTEYQKKYRYFIESLK